MDYIQALHRHGSKAHTHYGWLLYIGTLNIILGIFAVAFSHFSTIVTMLYLGWLFIFSGFGSLFLAYRLKDLHGYWSLIVLGALAVVCGVFMLFNPRNDAVVLTLLVAVFLFTTGLVSVLSCFFTDAPHKVMITISGAISIFCAYVIYGSWPFSGTWVPGTFMGIYLIFHGFTQVQIGAMGRRFFSKKDPDKAKK
jgi:uncharacterized membrane protein HdeD (DUF308 family)